MLSDALPKLFCANKIKCTASNQLIEDFANWLHDVFRQHCGTLVDDEAPGSPPPTESQSVTEAWRDFVSKRTTARRPSRCSRRPACAFPALAKQ